MVELFALLLALVVIGAAALILAPLRSGAAEGPESDGRTGTEDDPEVANLIAAREAALQTIQELDFDYRLGNLAEDDYRDLRQRHKLHAIALLKATQQTLGQGPRDGRTAESSDPVDLEIERAVQAHRQTRRMADPVSGVAAAVAAGAVAGANGARSVVETACPDCGRLLRPDDRFCSGCGAAIDASRGARVTGHGSQVAGHESRVAGQVSEPAGSGSGSGMERAAAQFEAVSSPAQDARQVGAGTGPAPGMKMTRGSRSLSSSRSTRDSRPATRHRYLTLGSSSV